MATKALLPVLGGSASVWSVSLAFYQACLLAGYAYAHLLATRLSLRRAAAVHAALVAAAVLLLPWRGLTVGAGPGAAPPAAWVVGQLAWSVGLPFFALAASGPLLQRWLASSADPYRLYAIGNASSLAALIGYPLLIERHLPLGPPAAGLTQTRLWSSAFVLFAALIGICAAVAARSPRAPLPAESPGPAAPRLTWIALAAVPSGALVATTQALTLDVASVPLLWVLPLAVYLVTFIVAFGRARPPVRGAAAALAVLALAAAACRWAAPQPDPHVAIPLDLGALLATGLVCHGRLAQQRPGPDGLTRFYLCLAAGGALGSLFCGLMAPLLFRSVVEHPLMLVLACLALPPARGRLGRTAPLAVAGAVAVVLVAAGWRGREGQVLAVARSFYGALRVVEAPGPTFMPSVGPHAGQPMSLPTHVLYSGTTLHGIQVTRPSEARLPTSYYHPSGPIGRVFAALRGAPGDVALVGLGVGSLAAYAEPGERFTFFEIDPQVVRIARDPALFTYLRDARGSIDVVVGDGRVALAALPDGALRLVVIDAFGSDAVPAHLLTREALAIDLRKLAPGGVVAFHLSSSFFDLAPVVAEAAASLGKDGLYWHDTSLGAVEVITGKRPSDWAVVAADPASLRPLVAPGAPWVPLASQRRTSGGPWLWTDRFSSPLAALRAWGGGIRAPRAMR